MADPLSGIPLASIRVFEAAARLKSFTRAAEELGMTQAAVSWQIKALEGRLGQSLFRRLPREVQPTEAGERLSRAATEAMALLRRAVSDLTEAQKKELKLKGGVKVETVAEASARAGIREGDIIVAIGNTEIGSVKEFDAAVAKADKAKPIPVLLRRSELATYLLIRPARG